MFSLNSAKKGPRTVIYYKTANEHYKEEEVDFNAQVDVPEDVTPENHPLQLHRLVRNRREDGIIVSVNRVHVPQRHVQTIRQMFQSFISSSPTPCA